MLDTTPKARAKYEELLRAKTGEERLRMGQQWSRGLQQLAFANIRQSRPDLTDDEIWLMLAARRLGDDVVRKVRERLS